MSRVTDLIRDAEGPMRAEHRRTLDKLGIRRLAGYSEEGRRSAHRQAIGDTDAVREVFRSADPDDFYPLLRLTQRGDEAATLPYRAVRHREAELHPALVRDAGAATYWNLLSYRPSAIKKNGRFTFRKADARAVFGVFIDFDGGRQRGDDKWEEPGSLLTQQEIWESVADLVATEIIPPFQLWADGTRGCYGIILFDEPMRNVEEAAELWRELRGYYYRRLHLLAADEGARAITQPLKAPGSVEGRVRYFTTGAPRTSFGALREFFKSHPHETDLSIIATKQRPFNVEQHARLVEAQNTYDELRRPIRRRPGAIRRQVAPSTKVAWLTARIDDWRAFIKAYRRVGYSRRRFFLDFASAVKQREFGLDGDATRAYNVALESSLEVNAWLDRPLSTAKVREQVTSADPLVHRPSEQIRLDMGITPKLALELQLRAFKPASVNAEEEVRQWEDRTRRALERQRIREAKAAADRERRLSRAQAQQRRAEAKNAEKAEKEKRRRIREAKYQRIEEMIRRGSKTADVKRATGAHQQVIARIRRRIDGK